MVKSSIILVLGLQMGVPRTRRLVMNYHSFQRLELGAPQLLFPGAKLLFLLCFAGFIVEIFVLIKGKRG